MVRLTEMPLSRREAISISMDSGRQFIKHYVKVMEDIAGNLDTYTHHIKEMQGWWDGVKSIKLKSNSNPLTDINVIDWFFTAGGDVEDYVPEELVVAYNSFVHKVLSDRDRALQTIFDGLRIG